MSWGLLVLLVVSTYALRALGLVVLGRLSLPPLLADSLSWAPAALIAGLVVFGTFSGEGGVTFDARAAGMAAAFVAAALRAPFLVIFFVAVIVTSLLRLVG